MTQTIQVHGTTYGVESDAGHYVLVGPRGANYGLIPCRRRDGKPTDRLYAFNLRNGTTNQNCLNMYVFSIENGEVVAHKNW